MVSQDVLCQGHFVRIDGAGESMGQGSTMVCIQGWGHLDKMTEGGVVLRHGWVSLRGQLERLDLAPTCTIKVKGNVRNTLSQCR